MNASKIFFLLLLAVALAPLPGTALEMTAKPKNDFELGMQAQQKGDHAKAIIHFIRAHHKNRSNPEILYRLAKSQSENNMTGEAIKNYYKVLRIDPDFAAARLGLGQALAKEAIYQLKLLDEHGSAAAEEHRQLKKSILEMTGGVQDSASQ